MNNFVLPEISFYSEEQLERAKSFSPAFAHLSLLAQKKSNLFSEQIRIQRQSLWARCVLAELYETGSTQKICESWSLAADQILKLVCDHLQREIPAPVALFAYGKLGSSELNLSSDIDLVFIAHDESPLNNQFLRQFQKLIQDPTDFGFCFRTDFDLRPGGRMGPLVPTVSQFEDYYGNYGEAWERLAFVRLRPLWGDLKITQPVMSFVEKFTFRRHLDYTLLSDLTTLRQKIHSQHIHRSRESQIDLKLGIGGIRDLELFVHALQVVHGGKDLDLRQKQTSEAFVQLEKKSILPLTDIDFLSCHYWNLRHLENLVQAENDQQSHILRLDFSLPVAFTDLKNQMAKCDQIVSSLLGKVDLHEKTLPATPVEQNQWLLKLGYKEETIQSLWQDLISTTVLSRQKERDESYRQRFLFLFIEELSKFSGSQDRSLFLLRDFVKATRAKATFYSLFLNQENLISQIARIFSTSPYLAGILCSRPEMIDSFIYKNQTQLSTDPQLLLETLSERKLLSELINGSEFLNTLDLSLLTERMSETADSICRDLLTSIDKESRLQILALGKWGGQELGLRSDLDFIFVTMDEPTEKDIKGARRFFNRLTETHQKGGSLYAIDLRLKPSGKGGLVVTSLSQLKEYLSTRAPAWERQAYLRARFLSWNSARPVQEASLQGSFDSEDLRELERIRGGLLKNSNRDERKIDLKYDEGGMVDIEFAVQVSLLRTKTLPQSPQTRDQLLQLGWSELAEKYNFMRLVEQLQQSIHIISTSCLEIDSEGFKFISTLLNCSENQLESKLRSALSESLGLLKRLDPRRTC